MKFQYEAAATWRREMTASIPTGGTAVQFVGAGRTLMAEDRRHCIYREAYESNGPPTYPHFPFDIIHLLDTESTKIISLLSYH